MSETVTINLLDPISGEPVQKWEFVDATVISIGRDASNGVVLTDAVVSRKHAELIRDSKGWSVASLGKNGVAIGGREIFGPTLVAHETVLRLATSGPYLEFRMGAWLNTPALRAEARRRWTETASERSSADPTIVVPRNVVRPRKPAG